MTSTSSEIRAFRPPRRLFGYDRQVTDEFREAVAILLEEASERLTRAEAELGKKRESERSLNDALLAAARTAQSMKEDARREADAIRAEVQELDGLVGATRSQLSAFLRETLEKLEHVSSEIERAREPIERLAKEEDGADVRAEEEAPHAEQSQAPEAASDSEESVVDRLSAYHAAGPP
jgi:hypothetical protein